MWEYDVPPEVSATSADSSRAVEPKKLLANFERLSIGSGPGVYKSARTRGESVALPPQEAASKLESRNPSARPSESLSHPHHETAHSHLGTIHRRALPLNHEEREKREELEKMKAEFAFPTTLFEATSSVVVDYDRAETSKLMTRTSFLRQDDLQPPSNENSIELTAYLPPIRDKAGLILAAEKAVARYNYRQLTFAREIIRHWRLRALRDSEYHQIQWELASIKDSRILASQVLAIWRDSIYWKLLEKRVSFHRAQMASLKCWGIWKRKMLLKTRQKELIHQNILMRKIFRAWKVEADSTRTKIVHFQLRNYVRTWRQRLLQSRAMEVIAQRRYERDLKYRAYWTMFYEYCNIRAPQIKAANLKRITFRSLRARLATTREHAALADDLRCYSILGRYLNLWRRDLVWTQDMALKADEERRYTLLYNAILCWRKEARLEPLIRQCLETRTTNRLNTFISVWRSRLRQIQAADHVKKINLLKSSIKSWRLQLRLLQHSKYVKSIRLSIWFDKYSAALADRCYKYHVWRRWFQMWQYRLHCLVGLQEKADYRIRIGLYRQLESGGLLCLQHKMKQLQQMRLSAFELQKKRLIQTAIRQFREKNRDLNLKTSWSASANYFFLAKKFVTVWKQSYEKRKRQHRKEIYKQVVHKRLLRIKTQALNAIVVRYETTLSLNAISYDFFQSGCRLHVAQIISCWGNSMKRLDELRTQADAFRIRQIVSSAQSLWIQRLGSIYELDHLCETYLEITRKDKLIIIFKKINNARFRRKLDIVGADMFRQRVITNRKKAIFRSWHWLVQERLDRRRLDEQLNRELALQGQHDPNPDQIHENSKGGLSPELVVAWERLDRGESSMDGTEGVSILDVDEWIPHTAKSKLPIHTGGLARIPQTPSVRAARARALMEGRDSSVSTLKSKPISTTPLLSPTRRFSKSLFGQSVIRNRPGSLALQFSQSMSSRLRQGIRELDDNQSDLERESSYGVGSADDDDIKTSGSTTTAAATNDSPRR